LETGTFCVMAGIPAKQASKTNSKLEKKRVGRFIITQP